MTTKHTPGPWFVSGLVRPSVAIGTSVVRMPIGKHDVADARLIAAAPELLAALEGLLSRFHWDVLHGPYIDAAEAAIAKAKGEA